MQNLYKQRAFSELIQVFSKGSMYVLISFELLLCMEFVMDSDSKTKSDLMHEFYNVSTEHYPLFF